MGKPLPQIFPLEELLEHPLSKQRIDSYLFERKREDQDPVLALKEVLDIVREGCDVKDLRTLQCYRFRSSHEREQWVKLFQEVQTNELFPSRDQSSAWRARVRGTRLPPCSSQTTLHGF